MGGFACIKLISCIIPGGEEFKALQNIGESLIQKQKFPKAAKVRFQKK